MRFFCLLMKTVAATMAQEHDENRLKIDLLGGRGFDSHEWQKKFLIDKNFYSKIEQKIFDLFSTKNFVDLKKKFFDTGGNRTHDPSVKRFLSCPCAIVAATVSSVNKKIAFWSTVL